MTKQTQMYVGIGVVAVVGYYIYKSMQPKKGFMNLTARAAAPDCGEVGGVSSVPGCGCPPKNGTKPIGTANDGTSVYPNGHVCCGSQTGPCRGTKDKGFVGDNSKVFKGDKSFVGNNSKVFKGDNFVGDNSRVFKGDKSFVGNNSKVFKGDK